MSGTPFLYDPDAREFRRREPPGRPWALQGEGTYPGAVGLGDDPARPGTHRAVATPPDSSPLSVNELIGAGPPGRRRKRKSPYRSKDAERRAQSWTVVMWWLIGALLVGWMILIGIQMFRSQPAEEVPAFDFNRSGMN